LTEVTGPPAKRRAGSHPGAGRVTIWTGLAGAVLVAFVTLAYLRIAAATQRRTAARMAYFDDCAGLFTDLRRGGPIMVLRG